MAGIVNTLGVRGVGRLSKLSGGVHHTMRLCMDGCVSRNEGLRDACMFLCTNLIPLPRGSGRSSGPCIP